MKQLLYGESILSAVILVTAGVAPNIFPIAMAGYGTMPDLATWAFLPSLVVLLLSVGIVIARGYVRLENRVFAGAASGFLATIGLEVVRITSFQLGGMPGDMPRLMGVLLTDRFMLGPSLVSDMLGWAYHFWNGAAFGVIFTVLLGRPGKSWAIVYGLLIGAGFLLSPVVASLGIGFAGLNMPTMPATVLLAHVAYGWILGIFINRWVKDEGWLFSAVMLQSPAMPLDRTQTYDC